MYKQLGSLFIMVLLLVSCHSPDSNLSEELFQSKDFTDEGLFTSGIEGPAVDKTSGQLYLVNFGQESTIGQVSPQGQASLLVNLPQGSTGNGLRFNREGHLFVADYTGHNVLKIELPSKKISVHAHNPDMNQPNDLCISIKGVLFASDPNWKASTGQLWRIDTDGSTTLLESDMGTTNGIELSPDESTLYVNESVQRNVWAYDLSETFDISNKRLLIQFPDHGMDGMRCDSEGHLFITRYGKGTVAMISPKGELLREIQMKGKKTSNIAFGGSDGRTCYVTLQDRGSVETFRTQYPGRAWTMWNGD